jgi:hypothetical protein
MTYFLGQTLKVNGNKEYKPQNMSTFHHGKSNFNSILQKDEPYEC